MILVDTSAWIAHLRRTDARVVRMLLEGRVRTCDVVLGELLLDAGVPKHVHRDLLALPRVATPRAEATRLLVARHQRVFAGAGIGWADVQIVHAAHESGNRVYTTDRAIRRVAIALGVRPE